ncbi:hypothetical protein NXS19_013868 [Fusarium pseudograminearum]|nr:hypothetical protein NXS19_013868 [Fusarium pseudograminearum]
MRKKTNKTVKQPLLLFHHYFFYATANRGGLHPGNTSLTDQERTRHLVSLRVPDSHGFVAARLALSTDAISECPLRADVLAGAGHDDGAHGAATGSSLLKLNKGTASNVVLSCDLAQAIVRVIVLPVEGRLACQAPPLELLLSAWRFAAEGILLRRRGDLGASGWDTCLETKPEVEG